MNRPEPRQPLPCPDTVEDAMSIQTATLDAVIDIVSRSLRRADRLGADSDIFALGADSMVMMSVVAQLEERFDIEFAPEDLVKEALGSPHAIATLLVEKYDVASRLA